MIVYKGKKAVWTYLEEDQVHEWKCAMAARIRAACRDVAQARRKTPMPAWVRSLLDDPDGEAAEKSDEETDENADDADEAEPDPTRPGRDRAPLRKPAAADSQDHVDLEHVEPEGAAAPPGGATATSAEAAEPAAEEWLVGYDNEV